MAISIKLKELNDIKQDIKQAIIDKGVNMEGKTFGEYGDSIVTIPVQKEEQAKTVSSPDFSSGDVVVTPDSGKVLSQVIVAKDSDLTSENILKDVNIFGVVGTLESGGGDDAVYIPLQIVNADKANTFQIDSIAETNINNLKQHIYYFNTTTNEWTQIPQVSGTWSLLKENAFFDAELVSIRFSVDSTNYDNLSYRYDGTNAVNGGYGGSIMKGSRNTFMTAIIAFGHSAVKNDFEEVESGINTLISKHLDPIIYLYANGTVAQKPNRMIYMPFSD